MKIVKSIAVAIPVILSLLIIIGFALSVLLSYKLPPWFLPLVRTANNSDLLESGADELRLIDIDDDGTPEILKMHDGKIIGSYWFNSESYWTAFEVTGDKMTFYNRPSTGKRATVTIETRFDGNSGYTLHTNMVRFINGKFIVQDGFFEKISYPGDGNGDSNAYAYQSKLTDGVTYYKIKAAVMKNLDEIRPVSESLIITTETTREERFKWAFKYLVNML
jgi:hypothetical protein